MILDVMYSRQAVKFLKKVDKVFVSRILEKIEKLKEEPVLHDSKKVEGFNEKLFRVRVGNCRILYEVDYKGKLINIVKIDKREKVY